MITSKLIPIFFIIVGSLLLHLKKILGSVKSMSYYYSIMQYIGILLYANGWLSYSLQLSNKSIHKGYLLTICYAIILAELMMYYYHYTEYIYLFIIAWALLGSIMAKSFSKNVGILFIIASTMYLLWNKKLNLPTYLLSAVLLTMGWYLYAI